MVIKMKDGDFVDGPGYGARKVKSNIIIEGKNKKVIQQVVSEQMEYIKNGELIIYQQGKKIFQLMRIQ